MSSGPGAVVGAVVVDRGRAFVIRRSSTGRLFPNCWDIPGGHVECGESDEEALARELEEEIGLEALEQVRAPLGEHRWLGDDGIARVERDFLVQVEGDLDRPRLEVEKRPEVIDLLDDQFQGVSGRRRAGSGRGAGLCGCCAR